MHTTNLRKVGGSVMLAVPPAILDLLLVHGILHLLGYDHEGNPPEALRMEKKSMEILKALGHDGENFEWYLRTGEE